MKTTPFFAIALAMTCLLSGCMSTAESKAYDKAVRGLEERMQPDWLKSNVIIGKTTKSEIMQWFGKPMIKNSMQMSGLAGAMMPDEIWTYSVKFTEVKSLNINVRPDRRIRTLAVSFKGDTVSAINTSGMEF